MCGIIGYIGDKKAEEVILTGLSQLEYRGYDSAGMAVTEENGDVLLEKSVGKVSALKEKCKAHTVNSHCGIGHTRWATHGGVTEENTHPHKNGKVILVHNGIIENFRELIIKFELEGVLNSETDTEVAAAVLNYYYEESGDPFWAIKSMIREVQGTYAFGILFTDLPGRIFAVRNVSPIVIMHTESESVLASDITALLPFGTRYFVLPEYHILEMDRKEMHLYDLSQKECEPEYLTADWEVNSNDKQGYPFYMEKEIMEQPAAMKNTIFPRVKEGLIDFSGDSIPDSMWEGITDICMIGCGTAMHACLVAKHLIQQSLRLPVQVHVASEFIYEDPLIQKSTLVIAVSQSGETIDTLSAVRLAKRYSEKVLSIVNVVGSTIARESNYVFYTNAGCEIAVASTKAYCVQLCAFYLIFGKLAFIRNYYDEAKQREFVSEFCAVIEDVELVLKDKENIHKIARQFVLAKDAFYIGRGLDYSLILEGTLKLKEVSYVHAEAYAAGELKHGTIALITEETPVVALMTQEALMAKTKSNAMEVRARGAKVILLTTGKLEDETDWNEVYYLPQRKDLFMTFSSSVVLQLIAYFTSLDKGLDVDKPRNLAKVVTVE